MSKPAQLPRFTAPRVLARLLCAFFSLLAATGEAAVTGAISGTVKDGNGKPIPGATVIVKDRQLGAFADSTGVFLMRHVPVGTFTVRAMALGWVSREHVGVEVLAGDTATLHFVLPSALFGDENAALYNGTYYPCEDVRNGGQSLVQVGVEVEKSAGAEEYRYNVNNRSGDTLTEVRIGYDEGRGVCELTGASPHVVPDTAFAPSGWICTPVQCENSMAFAVSWKARHDRGIPPRSSLSGFTIRVRRRDPLYSGVHWLAGSGFSWSGVRDSTEPLAVHAGRVRPRREVDGISTGTGTIAGRVADQGDRPIPEATIEIVGGGMRAVSAPDGSYRIANVPIGIHTLRASCSGYGRCGKSDVRVASGGSTQSDFHLPGWTVLVPCSFYVTSRERLDQPRPRELRVSYRGLGSDTTTRAFTATVRREFRNPAEDRLIGLAEETYPPSKAVASIVEDRVNPKDLLRESRAWWYGEFDGVRLPYAVTGDAVRYYLGLTETYRKGLSPERGGIKMKRTEFSYSATISDGPTRFSRDGRSYDDVYVVELKLSWFNYCGSQCACWFDLDRIVLLRPDGTLVCVFGDRKPMVTVS